MKRSVREPAANPRNQIYEKSCEKMSEIPDGAVALSVTSPPYWNAIDYDVHAEAGASKNYRTRKYETGFREYEEYLEWCTRVWTEVFRVTKPGGYAAVVIGTVLLKGQHFPVPFDFVTRLATIGWRFHQDIIWHKCTAGVKRAGSAIQKPFPGYFYPNIMTEYVLIFRKDGSPIYAQVEPTEREASRFPINRVFVSDVANNIWHIAPVPPGVLDHPCPFPEEIPYRLISLYSYRGELVLDPFAGSGQTLKVAAHLQRDWVGYELLGKYVKMARRRIEEPLKVRPEQLIAAFEKVSLHAPLEGPQRGKRRRTGPKLVPLFPQPEQTELSGLED